MNRPMDATAATAATVAIAGAVGGAAAAIFLVLRKQPLSLDETVPWALALTAYPLLGVVAAILGVYLVASTDTSQRMRCLAFAAACGLAWGPIFEASQAIVSKKQTAQLAAGLEQQARTLAEREARILSAEQSIARLSDQLQLARHDLEAAEHAAATPASAGAGYALGASIREASERVGAAAELGHALESQIEATAEKRE